MIYLFFDLQLSVSYHLLDLAIIRLKEFESRLELVFFSIDFIVHTLIELFQIIEIG